MKCKIILFFLSIYCFSLIFVGCTENTEKNFCVKCGKIATTTLSGPEETMESNGISISECTQITANVYTAYVCNSCIGPVAEIKPDP